MMDFLLRDFMDRETEMIDKIYANAEDPGAIRELIDNYEGEWTWNIQNALSNIGYYDKGIQF